MLRTVSYIGYFLQKMKVYFSDGGAADGTFNDKWAISNFQLGKNILIRKSSFLYYIGQSPGRALPQIFHKLSE